jgi:hypothetical protein
MLRERAHNVMVAAERIQRLVATAPRPGETGLALLLEMAPAGGAVTEEQMCISRQASNEERLDFAVCRSDLEFKDVGGLSIDARLFLGECAASRR